MLSFSHAKWYNTSTTPSYLVFHPDFNRWYRSFTDSVPEAGESRTVTASRELHPALKRYCYLDNKGMDFF